MKKIVIASVLKPVNDPRMLEKLGVTLAGQGNTQVYLFGSKAKIGRKYRGIYKKTIGKVGRLSFLRLMAPFKLFNFLLKVKPEILIVQTHELLIVTSIYKILFGTELYYDVQENYFRNILFTSVYPRWLKPFLAAYVRAKEWLLTPVLNGFILAEKCYEEEMTFMQKKCIVVENKSVMPSRNKSGQQGLEKSLSKNELISFLFSGTLSVETGVFDAISIIESLSVSGCDCKLVIIGFAPQKEVFILLKKAIIGKPYITLIGGNKPVAHREIRKAIEKADIGLITYQVNRATRHRIPTKLYEYIAYRLPILSVQNIDWQEILSTYNAGIVCDFEEIGPDSLMRKIREQTYYGLNILPDVYWESQEKELLEFLQMKG